MMFLFRLFHITASPPSLLLLLILLCTLLHQTNSTQADANSSLTPTTHKTFQRLPLNELPPLKNDLLLRAATNQPTPRVPVWCMRQAGRHLPEFKAISQHHDFFTMCQNPQIAVELSLQPLRRYGVDAVIIFSDILVIPQAMGMHIQMLPGRGPVFTQPLSTPQDIKRFNLDLSPDIDHTLGYVLDALNLARQKIDGQVPLIGFCGGPLSLLMFMVEGQSSKSLNNLKTWLYTYPKQSHELLQVLSNICVQFLIAQQQKGGAQVLQVFESVAVEGLTQSQYYEFVLPYLKSIARRVKQKCPQTPLIMFSKGTDYALDDLAKATEFDCLGLDWTSDPFNVRNRINDDGLRLVDDSSGVSGNNNNERKKALQGNLDPCVIYQDISIIESEVEKMLKSFGTTGYIANLGHGCSPDMDPKHVNAFIKCVQTKSFEMNNN